MQVMSFELPVFRSQDRVLEWPQTQTDATADAPPQLDRWIEVYRIIPQGEAFCCSVSLATQLRHEETRMRESHADPAVAKQWASEEAANLTAGADSKGLNDNGDNDGSADGSRYQSSSRKKKFVKLTDDDMLTDWYEVLKLEQQEGATDDQIKAAYRRRCLETHPDKQQNHSDEAFKKVQRAFDILSDPDTRQTYDSSRPFDDTIPGEQAVGADTFFSTFGPVFERNKKWSSVPCLPSIGTDETPYAEVLRFYDRWTAFQSWRDFSHLADLEEIDDSMCREEKRYYQRENARQLNHYHKEEQKRIRLLVERARKNDPRLRRHREEEEGKRLKELREREAFRLQLAAEEERRRAEENRKRKEKEEAEIAAQQEEKQAMRDAQTAVLGFLGETGLLDETPTNKLFADRVRRPNVQWIFSKVSNAAEARKIRDVILACPTERCPRSNDPQSKDVEGTEEVEAVMRFNALIQKMEQRCGVNRYGEAVKKVQDSDAAAAAAKKKESANAAAKAPVDPGPEWTEEDLSRLQKATTKYPPGTVDRWIKICDVLRHRFTEEQAMAKVTEITSALHNAGSGNPAAASTAAPMPTQGSATTATVSPVENWSLKQQKQLEKGLRDMKDYKEKDKYQIIANMVEGKTAKECFERFKFLCSVNKKK